MWVGHGSGRDREQTWASGWGSRVVPKSRWRGNGYADSTAEYLRAFTASGKIFRTGNYRSTFWPRRVAALCVARSIDTGYVLLQIRIRGIRVCVGEKIDARESELIERERRAIYRAVKSFEERIRLDTNSKMQRSISSGQFSRCMYSKGIDLFFRYRDFFLLKFKFDAIAPRLFKLNLFA